MVLLQLADFGGGESLVAGQEAVAAQRSGSTVTEEPGLGIGQEGAINRVGDKWTHSISFEYTTSSLLVYFLIIIILVKLVNHSVALAISVSGFTCRA